MINISRRGVTNGALAVAFLGTGRAARAQGLQEVSIGHTPSLSGFAARIAQELGLYEKHGLNARLVQVDSANAGATAVVARSLDAAISGPGELIAGNARGARLVVIANVYGGLNAHVILGKAAADRTGVSPSAPAADRLKAMDGLIFGSVSPTSAFTVTMRTASEDVGAKLRFAFMAQPAMQAALESGAIQGFIASAPFWVPATMSGAGVVWLSGPKGEFPRERTPAHSASVQVMRDFIEAKPDVARRLTAAYADLARAFTERPAEVKTAILKLFPSVNTAMLDRFYDLEARGFTTQPLTAADMTHEIAYVKASGANLPGIDTIDPKSLIHP
jgi:ABC-type nitrate/sulfonate/bicarbonate transport system substrate-binding protein